MFSQKKKNRRRDFSVGCCSAIVWKEPTTELLYLMILMENSLVKNNSICQVIEFLNLPSVSIWTGEFKLSSLINEVVNLPSLIFDLF